MHESTEQGASAPLGLLAGVIVGMVKVNNVTVKEAVEGASLLRVAIAAVCHVH